jgi:hypothetical protein
VVGVQCLKPCIHSECVHADLTLPVGNLPTPQPLPSLEEVIMLRVLVCQAESF